MKKLLLTQLFEAWETWKSKLQAGAQSNVERTEQLNLRTLACVQWDECFITIMYKGTLALDTAAFWSAYISRKTPACTAAKYC